jgi:hypothetical protein
MEEKVNIVISEVLALLESGHDREAIKAHYQISNSDLKLLFEHPKLKGKRPKKTNIIIVDDTEVYNIPEGVQGTNGISDNLKEYRQKTLEEEIDEVLYTTGESVKDMTNGEHEAEVDELLRKKIKGLGRYTLDNPLIIDTANSEDFLKLKVII